MYLKALKLYTQIGTYRIFLERACETEQIFSGILDFSLFSTPFSEYIQISHNPFRGAD